MAFVGNVSARARMPIAYVSRVLLEGRVHVVVFSGCDHVVLDELRRRRGIVERILLERPWQVIFCLSLDVGGGGNFDAAVGTYVDVHSEELLRLLLQGKLEAILKYAQVVVGLSAASVGHPAVVHVQYPVDSMSIRVLLEEVTRVEL
eukprot:4543900-Pleurochrysis_carterae.AAC.2